MTMDEGLVRLFDNNSSMEMAELGMKVGVIDLYVVEVGQMGEANEVLVSQLTQKEVHSLWLGNVARELFPEEEEQLDGFVATDTTAIDVGDEGDKQVDGVEDQVDGLFATDSDEGDGSDDDGDEGDDEGSEGDEGADGDEQMDGLEQQVDEVATELADVLRTGKTLATDKPSFHYNKVLLFAREKPLYGMLECIQCVTKLVITSSDVQVPLRICTKVPLLRLLVINRAADPLFVAYFES